jgi:hypothetical protein
MFYIEWEENHDFISEWSVNFIPLSKCIALTFVSDKWFLRLKPPLVLWLKYFPKGVRPKRNQLTSHLKTEVILRIAVIRGGAIDAWQGYVKIHSVRLLLSSNDHDESQQIKVDTLLVEASPLKFFLNQDFRDFCLLIKGEKCRENKSCRSIFFLAKSEFVHVHVEQLNYSWSCSKSKIINAFLLPCINLDKFNVAKLDHTSTSLSEGRLISLTKTVCKFSLRHFYRWVFATSQTHRIKNNKQVTSVYSFISNKCKGWKWLWYAIYLSFIHIFISIK